MSPFVIRTRATAYLPILPFVALLAGYLGNALGLPRVLVYEDFLVAAGLFDASPPSAQHPGVTRVQRQANVFLDALGLRCRIENPLANIPALEIVETPLLRSFSHKELKRLLNGTLGCCCGMCGPCLQDCAVLESLGCLTSSVVQETPNEQYPHRAAVVRFLTAVEDASTLSAAEMFSQFPGIAYTTQLPPVDALR